MLGTMTVDEQVGRKVHTLMWDQRMTNRGLAAVLGMDETTFSRKLRGGRKWTLEELLLVADALSVDVVELLPHLDSNQKPADYQTAYAWAA
jgi:transcriptional regulator with XRE-family HTH domain